MVNKRIQGTQNRYLINPVNKRSRPMSNNKNNKNMNYYYMKNLEAAKAKFDPALLWWYARCITTNYYIFVVPTISNLLSIYRQFICIEAFYLHLPSDSDRGLGFFFCFGSVDAVATALLRACLSLCSSSLRRWADCWYDSLRWRLTPLRAVLSLASLSAALVILAMISYSNSRAETVSSWSHIEMNW